MLVKSVSDARELNKDEVPFWFWGYTGDYKIELREGAVPKEDVPRTVLIALRSQENTHRNGEQRLHGKS